MRVRPGCPLEHFGLVQSLDDVDDKAGWSEFVPCSPLGLEARPVDEYSGVFCPGESDVEGSPLLCQHRSGWLLESPDPSGPHKTRHDTLDETRKNHDGE